MEQLPPRMRLCDSPHDGGTSNRSGRRTFKFSLNQQMNDTESPPVAIQERKSPADICINKRSTWVDFDPRKDVVEYGEAQHQIQVTIEHRAWVCPFCEQSTEYWLVNGMTVLGCGMSSLISNLKRSDCCDRWECRRKQEEYHKPTPAAPQPTNEKR